MAAQVAEDFDSLPRSTQRRIRRQEKREARKEQRHKTRADRISNVVPFSGPKGTTVSLKNTLKSKNKPQQRAINAMENRNIVVIAGQVGSGKTFLAAAKGVEMLLDPTSPIERIVLVRPNEPLGKSIGLLPGTAAEKLKPYLEPIMSGIEYMVGPVGAQRLLEQEKLEYVAVEHLRGRTWNNAFVIIDEANNLTQRAVAVSLLRKGLDTKIVFCGDIAQADIPDSGMELLNTISNEYENPPHEFVELIDTVRSPEAAYYAQVFQELGVQY